MNNQTSNPNASAATTAQLRMPGFSAGGKSEIANHKARTSYGVEAVKAEPGTLYAYARTGCGFKAMGMVRDGQREFYARHYIGKACKCGMSHEENATAVAYLAEHIGHVIKDGDAYILALAYFTADANGEPMEEKA